MRDDVILKLKCQQCKYQPNMPDLSSRNILNKNNNNNIHGYGANKRQLKGHLYCMTQIYSIILSLTTNVYVYCI